MTKPRPTYSVSRAYLTAMKKRTYRPPTPEERTAEKQAQLQRAFELGAHAAKEGKESTDYLPEFQQIFYYTYKTSPSLLLSQYFKGYHSVKPWA